MPNLSRILERLEQALLTGYVPFVPQRDGVNGSAVGDSAIFRSRAGAIRVGPESASQFQRSDSTSTTCQKPFETLRIVRSARGDGDIHEKGKRRCRALILLDVTEPLSKADDGLTRHVGHGKAAPCGSGDLVDDGSPSPRSRKRAYPLVSHETSSPSDPGALLTRPSAYASNWLLTGCYMVLIVLITPGTSSPY